MPRFSKPLLTECRKSIRSNIVLDAQVFIGDEIVLSKIINLSYDGACIALPKPTKAYGKLKIIAVDIPGIGQLSATKRWAYGYDVGISFTNPDQSGKAIENFYIRNPLGSSAEKRLSQTPISNKPERAAL